ncbi:glycosyltransferase [Subtercola sp. YIM 133946]|uniref:glycosyltransferase n=1 Tax=Subtercola sp. YIM 133946 TaxID=3118909 RepID=UPI002F9540A3
MVQQAVQQTDRVTTAVRVASVPAQHTYVQNSTAAARARGYVDVLADPRPLGAPAGQWWPPVILGAQWIEANAGQFDLLHVHFGFESFAVAELADRVAVLKRLGRPIVLTVHDLENPQLLDQGEYGLQLDVLVRGADELITLTPGAAAEIRSRWGREATVIPHPWMAAGSTVRGGDDAAGADRASVPEALRVGIHLRDLRPNIDAVAIVQSLLEGVTAVAGAGTAIEAVIDVNENVRDEQVKRQLRRLVDGCPFARWNEHSRFSDDELAESLSGLDISVLPYRHGTHSGWLELCWDLGVRVLAPAIGFYREQHDEPGAVTSFVPGSSDSFCRALTGLVGSLAGADGALEPAAVRRARRRALSHERMDARQHQSRQISAAQLAVYRRALARVAA